MVSSTTEVSAIVLAGGRAERLGGVDKGLIELAGRPLVEHVLDRVAPQVDDVVISANRNAERYAEFGHAVVADSESGYPGPLAGLLAGATRARHDWLLVVPCDTPFLPDDLVEGLLRAARAGASSLARASDGVRSHYAIMLLRRELLADLAAWLAAGERRVQAWQARHAPAEAVFTRPKHAFLNLNTAEDLRQAEALLGR
jgi:molybdopterin-guanine dinucleotide biosynthesis protein A